MRLQFIRLLAAFGLAATMIASVSTNAAASDKVLHSFQGGSDGYQPSGGLIADSAGNLYGATAGGGSGTGCYGGAGCGTVFKIARDGSETVLYAFQGASDGISPSGSLLMDNSGNIYGTTLGGGGDGCAGYGCGTVFKLAPDGTEAVLYTFQGGSDGEYPQGSLIADTNGNLYGLTEQGGDSNAPNCSEFSCGTVFELQPNGNKIALYIFQGGSDGMLPSGGLIADASGNLYGTTSAGGNCSGKAGGCGTVFKIAPSGVETVVYAFQGIGDGAEPLAGLIADSAGNLYGTTLVGGTANTCSCGTVFKLTPSGTETVLYSFKAGSDGDDPEAPLTMDKRGNLFGTTYNGGGTGCNGTGCGVVFEVTSMGKETVLETFKAAHGRNPAAGLLLGKNDILYGTTTAGGAGKHNDGVVFRVTPK